jgi:hypothetical protein
MPAGLRTRRRALQRSGQTRRLAGFKTQTDEDLTRTRTGEQHHRLSARQAPSYFSLFKKNLIQLYAENNLFKQSSGTF